MSLGKRAYEQLKDKVVLITGASAGIGMATALEYMDTSKGTCKLILVARRMDKLTALKSKILNEYPEAQIHIQELDVTELDKVAPFLEQLPEEFKDIDILINNAGKALGSDPVGEIDIQDVKSMIDCNVVALINMTQAVLPLMKVKNSGDIVNIGSVAGLEAYPTGSIYCSTKFAVRAFTDSLRKELIHTGIRVILIAPGIVETEFSLVRYKGDVERAAHVYDNSCPLEPQDVADLIVYTTSRRPNMVVAESLVFPTTQASPYHIYRSK